jgi:hypothetical protein
VQAAARLSTRVQCGNSRSFAPRYPRAARRDDGCRAPPCAAPCRDGGVASSRSGSPSCATSARGATGATERQAGGRDDLDDVRGIRRANGPISASCRGDHAIMRRGSHASSTRNDAPSAAAVEGVLPKRRHGQAQPPDAHVAVSTLTGAPQRLAMSRWSWPLGHSLGQNPAVLGRTRPNAAHLAAPLIG